MFSASVMELHRAPCWKSTPVRRLTLSLSSSVPGQNVVPSKDTVPCCGDLRPMSTRRRVDLPQPEPPVMKKMSPGMTSKLMSFMST